MRKTAIFPGLAGWDNIKLAEVWREFIWDVRARGIESFDQLSEHNREVYNLLRNEQIRRGVQLSLPYGSESS
jgi:hypothetical protein